jgi:hypothetical protein
MSSIESRQQSDLKIIKRMFFVGFVGLPFLWLLCYLKYAPYLAAHDSPAGIQRCKAACAALCDCSA